MGRRAGRQTQSQTERRKVHQAHSLPQGLCTHQECSCPEPVWLCPSLWSRFWPNALQGRPSLLPPHGLSQDPLHGCVPLCRLNDKPTLWCARSHLFVSFDQDSSGPSVPSRPRLPAGNGDDPDYEWNEPRCSRESKHSFWFVHRGK